MVIASLTSCIKMGREMRRANLSKLVVTSLFAVMFSSCASVGEQHYFASVDTETNEIQNVFRLTVRGESDFSNARYIAGYYDESAVDLFFNEIDSGGYSQTNDGSLPGAPRFFDTCRKDETTEQCRERRKVDLSVVPLGSGADGDNRTFVILFSSRADAIAQTIGAIAEDSTIKKGLFRLANKDTIKANAALSVTSNIDQSKRRALKQEIGLLITEADGKTSNSEEYLGVLAVVARGLSPSAPVRFENWDKAQSWFESYSSIGGL